MLLPAATFFSLLLLLAEPAGPQTRSIVLFDFEQGVAIWHGELPRSTE
jgi:hypothetical protein